MSTNLEHEVWKTDVGSEEYNGDHHVYYVFAHSAGEAEKKALKLAKNDDIEKPYCSSASFVCVVKS